MQFKTKPTRKTSHAPGMIRARAFTLIEIMVVIAIIAIFAGLIFPRITGNARRQAIYSAEETADLLSMFAHRHSMGNDRIAIGFDPDANTIMLLELVGDPADPTSRPYWDFDVYASMVRLPDSMIMVGARQDGRYVAEEDWFIPIIPGEGRPNIEIDMETEEGLVVTVYLPSYKLSAHLIYDRDDKNVYRLPVDLDALGRDREIW